jgi:hypothetical protein
MFISTIIGQFELGATREPPHGMEFLPFFFLALIEEVAPSIMNHNSAYLLAYYHLISWRRDGCEQ